MGVISKGNNRTRFYAVDVDVEFRAEARMWIQENFGPSKRPSGPWSSMKWYGKAIVKKGTVHTYKFYFRNSEHATLFALRWAA